MIDTNINVIERTPDGGGIEYQYIYNADNKIIEIKKGSITTRKFVYDGDGNRVVEELHEGFISGQEEKTVFISNYYEETIRGTSDSIQSLPDSPYKMYFPFVGGPDQLYARSYYYADGERIAMRHEQSYYYVFGDHLGSTTSIVERETGRRVNYQLYHPWGTTRYSYNSSGEKITDYGYTGQTQVDDIYYYNVRWYDPMLGRFMQADTLVPPHQGTQGFDRYAYVNNNPMRYTDPTGHWFRSTNLMIHDGGGGKLKATSIVFVASGSFGNDEINKPGPLTLEQMPAWGWNPFGLDMEYYQYPGNKSDQSTNMLNSIKHDVHTGVCYSASSEPCLQFTLKHIERGYSIENLILIGPTFTGADVKGGTDVGYIGWKKYLDQVLDLGVNVLIINDGSHRYGNESQISQYEKPQNADGAYGYHEVLFKHFDGGRFPMGSNNSDIARIYYYSWLIDLIWSRR